MKRLAMAVMLAALAIAPAAVADPRHGGGHFEGGRVGGYRGFNGGGFPASGGFGGRGGFQYRGSGEYRVAPRFVVPPQQPAQRYGYGGYGPAERYGGPTPITPAPGPSYESWRRGQHLSPAYRGAVVNDYPRYHLRRPPRGYYWTRVGDDFVLTAQGSGLVFDVIGADGR